MEKLTFTYFIQDELGNVKIGKSNNPEKRLTINQTGNALKLTLLLYIFGDKEKRLHQKFNFYKIRNSEWFKPNKQLTRFITLRMDGFNSIKEKRKFHESKMKEERIWRERYNLMIKEIQD